VCVAVLYMSVACDRVCVCVCVVTVGLKQRRPTSVQRHSVKEVS